jgi:predicted lipid-binding transport protein (Tim44 family)
MGGGKSFGRQSGITQRNAAPTQNAAPAPAQSAQQASAARSGAAAPAKTGSRWAAPLAGLAAGLGLAALANWLGFGEGLANIMLIALLAFAAIFVIRMIMARRQTGHAGPKPAFQGAYPQSTGKDAPMRFSPAPQDTSSRGSSLAPLDVPAAGAGAAAIGSGVPADFDVDGFLRTAKVQFVRLQAAHDAADLNDLRDFTSPEMFAELKLDIADRKDSVNRTDVVTLDAELLGIETTAVDYLASVRFTGMIREEEGAEAKPFNEIWVLAKPVSGGGWVLGGIQQAG